MHRLGDIVDVKLVEAAPVAGALRFELLSGADQPASRHRRRESPAGKAKAKSKLPISTKKQAAKGAQKARPDKSRKPKSVSKSGKSKKGQSWTP
jgi:ribonuclease R